MIGVFICQYDTESIDSRGGVCYHGRLMHARGFKVFKERVVRCCLIGNARLNPLTAGAAYIRVLIFY